MKFKGQEKFEIKIDEKKSSLSERAHPISGFSVNCPSQVVASVLVRCTIKLYKEDSTTRWVVSGTPVSLNFS